MDNSSKLILDIYDIAQGSAAAACNGEILRRFRQDLSFESALIGDLGVFGDRLVPTGAHLHNMPAERISARQSTMGEELILVNGTIKTSDPALAASFRRRGKSIATDIARTTVDPDILAYCRKYETAHSLTWVPTAWCRTGSRRFPSGARSAARPSSATPSSLPTWSCRI